MFPTIDQIFRSDELHEILIEIAVIWICVFLVVRFLKGTRGAGIVKGFAVLLVLVTITIKVLGHDTLARLNFIYDRFLGLLPQTDPETHSSTSLPLPTGSRRR